MIESLITSKTRIKILLKFFLNSQATGYLRNLETEFAESTNSIRIELNKLEKAGFLLSSNDRNKKLFYANTNHPLFSDINSIIRKVVGIDQIIEKIASKIGNLEAACLVGNLAEGRDSKTIDLIFIGSDIDQGYIDSLIAKAKGLISREVKYHVLTKDEAACHYAGKPVLMIWSSEYTLN